MTHTGDPETWAALIQGRPADLVAAVLALRDPMAPSPADVARLRELGSPEAVAVALELTRARRRAAGRIEGADTLFADVEGVEQASGTRVARHKAARFAAAGVARVVDLCCGIGGDAIELAAALGPGAVLGVDLDPVRALMTLHNARCESVVADAAGYPLDGAAFHIDPARRIERGGKRLRKLVEYRPGLDVLVALCAAGTPGAIKLGPGVSFDEVPERADRELEIVGDRGGLVQAVLWCGSLAREPGARTATRLETGETFSARPRQMDRFGAIDRFLLVPDPALERAGLTASRADPNAREIVAGLGLLTAGEPSHDPWFRSFEVLAEVPWREKKLREALRDHDAGVVRVKIRGGIADANVMERALRGDGSRELWVIGFRRGARAAGVVACEHYVDRAGNR